VAEPGQGAGTRVSALNDRRALVYIGGSGHSGSTLLDMILGGHSSISSLGEAAFLSVNVNNFTPADVCTCGEHVTKCPFWMRVEEAARALLGTNGAPALPSLTVIDPRLGAARDEQGAFRKRRPGEPPPARSRFNELMLVLGSARLRRWGARLSAEVDIHRSISRNLVLLYEATRRAHGTPIVVDSSKNPGYLKGVHLECPTPMVLLFLARDGRAVCESRMRREGLSMEQSVRLWTQEHLKHRAVQLTIPRRSMFFMRYEDLCRDPRQEVSRLCERLGVEFEEGMLDFRRDRHNLGGNPMRLRRHESEIRLDDGWRRALSTDDLRCFERLGGALNRRLGYGAP
jgi:sulfotransferase family protein